MLRILPRCVSPHTNINLYIFAVLSFAATAHLNDMIRPIDDIQKVDHDPE